MALKYEDTQQLAQQLQDAHRFAAGFYHRFLPMMNNAANTHGFAPYSWGNERFNNPAVRKPTPARNWVWDLLPMSYTRFSYMKSDNTQIIDIYFVPDSGLACAGFPDPFDMKESEPSVTIEAYGLNAELPDTNSDVFALWEKSGKPSPEETNTRIEYDTGLVACKTEVSLASFMLKPEQCIADTLQVLAP